ncbi:hypothetical protein Tco_0881629 [Tanacetum coccineum]
MESIRRNFFNGVQCDERKIVWIKWAKVLASKKYGGLGVSSFYALNRALLFKWVWRFISRDNSLWCRLIMSMHGSSLYKLSPLRYSTWKSIMEINKDCTVADKLQFSVTSSLRRSVRGRVESSQLARLQTYIKGTLLSNMEDRWVWDLNGEGVKATDMSGRMRVESHKDAPLWFSFYDLARRMVQFHQINALMFRQHDQQFLCYRFCWEGNAIKVTWFKVSDGGYDAFLCGVRDDMLPCNSKLPPIKAVVGIDVTTIASDFQCSVRKTSIKMLDSIDVVAAIHQVRSFVAESDNAYEGGPLADDYYSKSGSSQFINHVRKSLLCILVLCSFKPSALATT